MDRTSATRRQSLARAGILVGTVGAAGCLDGASSGVGEDEQGEDDGEETTESTRTDQESTDDQETTDEENGDDGGNGENGTDEDTDGDGEDDGEDEGAEGDGDDADDNGEADDESEEEGVVERPRDVSFQSTGDADLQGTIYGNDDWGIVLTPQINRERGSWEPQATRLAEEGYLAFAIDVDEDDRPASILGSVSHLREEQDVDRIVLVGASIGGEASVVANARADDGTVHGVVAISPGGGADHAGDLAGEKLFAVAEGDDDRFVETTERLHEDAPEPAALRIYDGGAHGQGLFETDHGDDLLEGILGVVGRACES